MQKKLFKRESYLKKIRPFYDDVELIKVLTGIRRCGKSSIMELVVEELIESGVDESKIFYINLDKRPYIGINTKTKLEELLSSKLDSVEGMKYLFLDEVQNVKDFEIVLNAFREESNVSIFITGSNSYLLSGELVTKLTGRYIEFKIGTLTFPEWLEMKKYLNRNINYDLNIEFNEYILNGGFPYTLYIDDVDAKDSYIKDLNSEIFNKDIKKNCKIRDKQLFEQVETYMINNFGATTSVNNICKFFEKINKVRPSKKTIYSYLNILENAKILQRCQRFDLKSKKSLLGEEKYYLTDLSFYFATNNDRRINYGPILENIIYNYSKFIGYELSIGKIGNLEVDFIARNKNEYAYIQVAMTIHGNDLNEKGIPYVEEREYRSLESIEDNYPKYVLTMDSLLQNRNGIHNKNIIQLMLSYETFK